MKFGIMIESNDPETSWNGLRFAIASLKRKHEVKIFLMSKGVECLEITHEKYNSKQLVQNFVNDGGIILACGTCIEARKKGANDVCPISTMNDCIDMIEWADKTITF